MSCRTSPPAITDPVDNAASHVDYFLGTSFDVVYEVYKKIGDFPYILNFMENWIPRLEKSEIQLDIFMSSTVPLVTQLRNDTEQLKTESLRYRNEIATLQSDLTAALQRIAVLEAIH